MEDCSPDALASCQLVAGLAGEDIDDRNRPFIEKSSEFNYCAAVVQQVQKQYGIPDSVMQVLCEALWDAQIVIANSRVEDRELPPLEDPDLS